MRLSKLGAILILAGVISGCGGGNSTPVTVTISPVNQTVVLSGTQQFSASVVGVSNTTVTWQVCNQAPASNATGSSTVSGITLPTGCVTGGNATLGTISTTGLFTSPAILPSPPVVSLVATSQAKTTVFAIVNVSLDTGIRVSINPISVTIGTTEQFQFTATVSGTSNSSVNWSVNQIVNGNSTVGTIAPTVCTAKMPITPTSSKSTSVPGTSVACYTAPAAQNSVTVTATSAADSRQAALASVGVLAATDPSFSTSTGPLNPSSAVEGSLQQDVYLLGNNFFSTNQILVNNAPVPTTFLNPSTLRATVPSSFFGGPSPASLSITIQRQNGDTSQPATFNVEPTRPALIAAVPDSFPSSTTSGTLSLNGGYFSSSTRAASGGQALPTTAVNSRQLQATLSSPSFPFSTPGLFPILVQNSDVPNGSSATSSVNVAVAPSAANIPTTPNPPITVGTKPDAVAIDAALGTAVVVDHGASGSNGAVSLVSLDTNAAPVTLPVGNAPTGVGVDDILHVAAVVNSADNTLSIVNLQTQAVTPFSLPSNPTGTTPAPAPYSIGVDPLTHRALVAYSMTNIAAVVDLSTTPPSLVCVLGGSNPSMANNCAATPNTNTRPVSTGPTPAIAIAPQLNWAIVTPGGSGSISIVDLGTPATATQVARVPNVIASVMLSTSVQGVAIDTETGQALLTDPNATTLTALSVLDQTVNTATLTQGEVADAINPLADVAVVLNSIGGTATVLDLRTLQPIGNSVTVGKQPQAVAIDAGKNVAVIANEGDNTVSILPLGPIRSPQITEISPGNTFTSSGSGSLTITVNGFGFASGSQVRIDGSSANILTSVSSNGRQAIATISGSLLAAPRRFSLDVMTPSGVASNEESFAVIGTIPIGLNPIAVAIDPNLREALVSSQGPLNAAGSCTSPGTVSLVSLSSMAVTKTFSVGTCPEGVAVLPRLGLGVVANNGSNDATVIDYVNKAVTATVTVGTQPAGVAIQPDTATAVIANSGSNTVSQFTIGSGNQLPTNTPVDQRPFGVSVDPIDNLAAITASTQNNVDIINLSNHFLVGRVPNFQVPSDATFDPITDTFLVANSLQNDINVVDPNTFTSTPIRVGINPTAVAYNFQSGTGVSVNNATNTLSIFNFLATNSNSVLTIQAAKVQFILPMGGSAEFSVAIDSMTNLAAVVDQANGRLLLIPLPR